VRAEAGIVIGELGAELDRHGLAMENVGDIDVQTLAGSISTGTHGTGARFPNLSAQIEAVELVLGDGSVHECAGRADAEALLAARVGIGALGVVSAVTLRTVPAFRLRRVDHPEPLDETLANLDELADRNDHFEFFVFPHTETALLRESERTDEPPDPPSAAARFLDDVVLENWALDAICRLGRRFPDRIPRLAGFMASQVGRSVRMDRSYRVFATTRRVRFTEMEYAIPRRRAAEAVPRVLELARSPKLDVSFPIEVRFVAPDDALLSPAHERDTAYVAVHMYRGMEWERYFRGVEEIMDDYGGRPHWGKRHFQTAETLAGRYPRWNDFQRVRARLDPDGRFRNAYTDRVLGGRVAVPA
jgi:L-gulono-1,4-lactone dehydrogenase